MQFVIIMALISIFSPQEIFSQEATPAPIRYYVVDASSLYLRSEPSAKSKPVALIRKGRILKVSDPYFGKEDSVNGVKGKWIEVEDLYTRGQLRRGYVFNVYLKPAKYSKPYWGNPNANAWIFECKRQPCPDEQSNQLLGALSPAVVWKTAKGFNIVDLKGKELKFDDVEQPEINYRKNFLLKTFADERYFLVLTNYWEGSKVQLVDRKNGSITSLWDYPVPSSDFSHLFVASASQAHNPNGIQIIRLSDGPPKIVLEEKLYWFPCLPSWESESSVKLFECFFESEGSDMLLSEKNVVLENEKWVIIE